MMFSTMLMAGQTVASGIQGYQSTKSAKKVSKYQKEMAYDDLMYNKGQLYDYANNMLANTYSQYAQARADQLGEYTNVASELNAQMSAQGVNLADSSVAGDMDAKLDFEFEKNMQNSLTNQINTLSNIISGVANQDYQLERQYNNAIYSADSAVLQVEQQATSQFFQNLGNTLISGAQDFEAQSARDDLASKLNQKTNDNYVQRNPIGEIQLTTGNFRNTGVVSPTLTSNFGKKDPMATIYEGLKFGGGF